MPAAGPHADLRESVRRALETIIDPCSQAMGAPAGLISLGLVRNVAVDDGANAGARVRVTLCITEPGCLMAALFQEMAQRELSRLPGVGEVDIVVDHGHIWDPQQMEPQYRRRLSQVRAARMKRMSEQRKQGRG
jgi:metal-sulfur cluster biosynthetic enzyme